MNSSRTHIFLLITIIFIAAILIFSNLGDRLLWQDEAETALLARSISIHHIPVAWDGKNIDTGQSGTEFDNNFVWHWSAWGSIYLAYLGSRIFGETPLGFRIHSAVFGLLTIIAAYFASKRWTGNRRVALFSTFLLLLCIPFLLYSRQCRYYSVISFLGVVALWSYAGIPRRVPLITFIISSASMAYFNELSMGLLLTFVMVYAFISDEDRRRWKWVFLAMPFITLLMIPQFIQRLHGGGKAQGWHALNAPIFGIRLLKGYFEWNNVVFPAIALALLWLSRRMLSLPTKKLLMFMTSSFIIYPFVVAFFLDPNIHYATFAFVMAAILAASALSDLYKQKRIVTIIAAAVFFGTNLFAIGPIVWLGKWFPSERVMYLREISSHYRGPTEATVDFFNSHAREGEVVATDYEQLPLMLHTKLAVANVMPKERALAMGLPRYTYDPFETNWVVPKMTRCVDCPGFDSKQFLQELEERGARLTPFPLNVADLKYGNSPTLTYHAFVSPPPADNQITVYKIDWPKK